MKNVLIAHQSTIPHYRVPFYNALNRLKPLAWRFEVVFDPSELKKPTFFKELLDPTDINFPIYKVHTIRFSFLGKPTCYQTFLNYARKFDLIVLENAVNNLSYPLCHSHQLFGKKIVYWGHGKDRKFEGSSLVKQMSERSKMFLVHRANGIFAYTQSVADYLTYQGIPTKKIFVLNNTIDIVVQRNTYETCLPNRTKHRDNLNLNGQKVLLFVGRFTENKRIEFLLKSFEILESLDSGFHLLMVGSGGERYQEKISQSPRISYFGSIVNIDELAPIYTASDLFVFPGSVGLGPLQALCYDLPVISIDSPFHMPEIEYLSSNNAVILDQNTNPDGYARAIINLFNNEDQLELLKSNTWPSIRHLTIEQMAKNFIDGINILLEQ